MMKMLFYLLQLDAPRVLFVNKIEVKISWLKVIVLCGVVEI